MKNIYLKIKIIISVIMFCSFVCGFTSSENADIGKKESKTPYIEYHNRMSCFSPLHQCYERIKNNALYAGVEAWFVGANYPRAFVIGEAEFRMGYNFFFNCRDHLTPIAGVGIFKDFKRRHYYLVEKEGDNRIVYRESHEKHPIVYAALGFLYDHEFNSVFNLGLNAKGLFGGPTKAERSFCYSKDKLDWGKTIVGVDVAAPITFRFGKERHWDARLEPFDIYVHGEKSSMNYWGFRSTLGYRF